MDNIILDIQDPKCDPEKLFRDFRKWVTKIRSIPRGCGFYIRDLRGWIWSTTKENVHDYFVPNKKVIFQLIAIWKEAGFIYEAYDDEKDIDRQLFYFRTSDIK